MASHPVSTVCVAQNKLTSIPSPAHQVSKLLKKTSMPNLMIAYSDLKGDPVVTYKNCCMIDSPDLNDSKKIKESSKDGYKMYLLSPNFSEDKVLTVSKYQNSNSILQSFNNPSSWGAAYRKNKLHVSCCGIDTPVCCTVVTCGRKFLHSCQKTNSCEPENTWTKSNHSKMFLNLKHSLFGKRSTEKLSIIGGSKPLVFGGTYPIDMPLGRRLPMVSGMPHTYEIDAPCSDLTDY